MAKTHYPDDEGRPLCGLRGEAHWPKPRPIRLADGSVITEIVPADVECKNCRKMSIEWSLGRHRA